MTHGMTPDTRRAQFLYAIGLVVFAVLAVLSFLKIIDDDTAASVSAAVTAVLGLFGVTVTGTATYRVTKQAREGMFDPPQSSADKVITGIGEVIETYATAQAEVDRVKAAVSTAVQDVPVLGPLAQQAIGRLP
jgi:hypothetical protein